MGVEIIERIEAPIFALAIVLGTRLEEGRRVACPQMECVRRRTLASNLTCLVLELVRLACHATRAASFVLVRVYTAWLTRKRGLRLAQVLASVTKHATATSRRVLVHVVGTVVSKGF